MIFNSDKYCIQVGAKGSPIWVWVRIDDPLYWYDAKQAGQALLLAAEEAKRLSEEDSDQEVTHGT